MSTRRGCAALALCLLVLSLAALASGQRPEQGDEIRAQDRRSGYAFLTRETQAMQDDDLSNPGFLWVLEGQEQWRTAAGTTGHSCADCHGEAPVSMKGVAARYPAYDARAGRVISLEQRIIACRLDHQRAPALAYESRELLALTAYVGLQSRGIPVGVTMDGPARPFFEAGRAEFLMRQGQFNLSCAQCHEEHWQQRLRGLPISQGQSNAYPAYRLEWQALGSLQRRLRNCNFAVRAEPYPYGAQEYVNLELFLAWRARGLLVETPGVRR
jgi:sulfur-oxidizing protein SoxA